MYDAEASPPADLWARIDHDLTVQENALYKKRVVFYRQLAAACLALLLLAGGFAAFYLSGGPAPGHTIAAVQPEKPASDAVVERQETVPAEPAAPRNETSALALAATPEERKQATVQRAGSTEGLGEAKRNAAALVQERKATSTAGLVRMALAQEIEARSEEGGSVEPLARGPKVEIGVAMSNLLYGSARQAIAAVPKDDFNKDKASSFAASGANPAGEKGFLELNKQVMDRVKAVEKDQEEMLLAFSKEAETTGKKDGQENSSESDRWSLGMAYMPSFFDQNVGISGQRMGIASSRMGLMPSDFSAVTASESRMDEARKEFSENTEPGFSFSFEVKTGFKLANKLKLLAGLGFSQNSARSRSSYVIEQFWDQPESGERVSPGPTTIFLPSISTNFATDSINVAKTDAFTVNYRYRHLIVPVGLQYEGKLGKEWFWYTGGGVAANILMGTTIMASTADVKDVNYDVGDESPFRKLQWSGNVSAGVGKRLSNNMSVTVGPEFRGYFDTLLANPEQAQAPQGRPYTVGLNMGVNYDLGKDKNSK